MQNQTDLEKGRAREEVCRLLAACYYEPEQAFLDEDVFGRLSRGLKLLDDDGEAARMAEAMDASFLDCGTENLLVDYSRLFLGPFDIRAKPYGSVYLEGEKVVMGDSTVALQELYRRGGFELAEDFKEMPDHIAAELEFLYLLIFQENEARRVGDSDSMTRAVELKRELLDTHLGRWLGSFAKATRQGADTDFYRNLASITESFVRLETEATKAECAA